jgi:hypothetical protein
MQKEAEEVYPQITTPQPKQHTNNVNAKCKKPQTAPANLSIPKPPTTTNKHHNTNAKLDGNVYNHKFSFPTDAKRINNGT